MEWEKDMLCPSFLRPGLFGALARSKQAAISACCVHHDHDHHKHHGLGTHVLVMTTG